MSSSWKISLELEERCSDIVTMGNNLPIVNKRKWNYYHREISATWRKVVESIIEVGTLILAANEELDPNDWMKLVDDLPFGYRTAERLMAIASDKRLTKKSMRKKLPPCWSTLYELSQYTDEEFDGAIDAGFITPKVKRKDVVYYRNAERLKAQGKADYFNSLVLKVPGDLRDTAALGDLKLLAVLCKRIFARPEGEPQVLVSSNIIFEDLKYYPDWEPVEKILEAELEVAHALMGVMALAQREKAKANGEPLPKVNRTLSLLDIDESWTPSDGLFRYLMNKALSELGIGDSIEDITGNKRKLQKAEKMLQAIVATDD